MEIHPASWLQSIFPLQQELPCSCSVLGEEPVIRPDASCLLQMLPGPQDHLLCRLIKTWGSWKGSEGPRGSGITPRSGSGFCGEAARLSSTPPPPWPHPCSNRTWKLLTHSSPSGDPKSSSRSSRVSRFLHHSRQPARRGSLYLGFCDRKC